ncbi:MAG: GTP pyrophosphokinase [Lachnospiraceae bacterium]|nr:GTP pyrophosphokinase [Lachnospiraceae bacterium]
MISFEEFKEKFRLTDEQFETAGVTWEDLSIIYRNYEDRKPNLEKILDSFMSDYFSYPTIRNQGLRIHSIRSRVKDGEHLIDKIVRRKNKNALKYDNCNTTNYLKFITDAIGIRILLVYKTDWEIIHDYIVNTIEHNEKNYVRDCLRDFDEDENHTYISEAPKVHVRKGDRTDIYEHILPPDKVISDRVYRSVHYIVKYKGIYVEIQVRTLFEEGWGEVDHSILYPTNTDNPLYKEYTLLLNRLSGLADEMSSFFISLRNLNVQKENIDHKDESNSGDQEIEMRQVNKETKAEHGSVTYSDAVSDFIIE